MTYDIFALHTGLLESTMISTPASVISIIPFLGSRGQQQENQNGSSDGSSRCFIMVLGVVTMNYAYRR